MPLLKGDITDLHSRAQQDCVYSNEMAARRRHIKRKCYEMRKETLNPKLDALNLFTAFTSAKLNTVPILDSGRLYVLKYR